MALTPGTRVAHYAIKAMIGSGGMGDVYRARDTKLDRDVALKTLRSDFASDPERLTIHSRSACRCRAEPSRHRHGPFR
jgi:eukaryotic-like serine/threonine-protein kinase